MSADSFEEFVPDGINEAHAESEVKMLDRKVAELMEHFDTVQIFVTKVDGMLQQTGGITRGDGNHYARMGQVQEYVTVRNEESRDSIRIHHEEE